jgi:putative ABC transport system permease protein
MLLAGAALLLHSWWRLLQTPTGMDESQVWAASITLPPKYRDRQDQIAFFLKALDAARAYSGVDSAGLITSPPLAGLEMMWPNVKPQGADASQKGVTLSLRMVTLDYFHVLRIPVLEGRLFSDTDTSQTEHVAVLNESAARALFPRGDGVGQLVTSYGKSYRIAGVIADTKMRRLDLAPSPQLYASYLQEPQGSDVPVTLMLRMKGAETDVHSVIRSALAKLDPDVSVAAITMNDVRWQKTAAERFRTLLLVLFASTAVFLALIGMAGVVGYAVAQRAREIGIRVAIGADRRRITSWVAGQSLVPAGIGLLLGLMGSLAMSRVLAGFLFEVQPIDSLTLLLATLLLSGAAWIACAIPARRAASIDPCKILRS